MSNLTYGKQVLAIHKYGFQYLTNKPDHPQILAHPSVIYPGILNVTFTTVATPSTLKKYELSNSITAASLWVK